jgi:hypothetical protein
VKKQFYNSVIAIPLSGESDNPIEQASQKYTPLLGRAWSQGFYFGIVPISPNYFFHSDEARMISYSSSCQLGGIILDGRKTDAVINDVGFLVAGKNRAVLMRILFISPGGSISTFEDLKSFVELFRFTA